MLQMLNQCCLSFQEYEDILLFHGLKVVTKSNITKMPTDDSPRRYDTANNSVDGTPALAQDVRDGFGTALSRHNKQIGFE